LIRDIPLSLHLHGGSFWSELKDRTFEASAEIPQASRLYSELGFGLGQISPLRLQVFFTWQLSHYDTDRFSFDLGFGF
jgi:hypothetical protein